MPEYRAIEAGDYTTAIAGLTSERQRQLCQLNARLCRMARVLEYVTPQIAALAD